MLSGVDPWALNVLTVKPFAVKERVLRPHTSVQVWPEQSGSSSSPPLIVAVPLTVWAPAELIQKLTSKIEKQRMLLPDFIIGPYSKK
jgi:hypothetical protein